MGSFTDLKAQMILNEVYCSPGAGNNEFFELYNSNTSPVPSSVDGITIVTYLEEGTDQGFYVMDLPNLTVPPRGFFVGSSALPFNCQGINNSTSSDFSWNDLAFMTANNAYLKKWIVSNANALDGNAFYDELPVPANFNDFFYRKGGNGASYSMFVYQNGILQNAFFGGNGGGENIPEFILEMPRLHIDMSSSATDFDIDFQNASAIKGEFVIQDAGSDNGFMRTKDGMCGEWTKSSANVFHTPKSSNSVQKGTSGEISVSRAIVRGTALTGSIINYDVVGAPNYAFPIVLKIYLDNGTVAGQLDADDSFIESNTEYTLSDGGFSTLISPYDYDVMIVVNSAVGCIDKIIYTPNATTLPVKLISFEGEFINNKASLKWTVSENEGGEEFEVEKSSDGKSFKPIGTITPNLKTGQVSYYFTDATQLEFDNYYRLKIINNNQVMYSKLVLVKPDNKLNGVRIMENPVTSNLKFSYSTTTNTTVTLNVYNVSGSKLYTNLLPVEKEKHVVFNLDVKILPGLYILEIIDKSIKSTAKFIKR